MKSKPQANKTGRTNIDLGQKEAAMEKLGKDKMSHMGAHGKLSAGEKSKPASDRTKPGIDDRLQHYRGRGQLT
jgi:hypothetical protein